MKACRWIVFLVLSVFFSDVRAQEADTLEWDKKPVNKFKKNMSIRNAWLKLKYSVNKTPVSIHDSSSRREGWTLTFEDNFDSLDLKKWRPGQAWGEMHPDNPHQYYSASEVQVKNGYLYLGGSFKPKLIRYNDSVIRVPYAIGLINTDISFTQKYGYFEIRSMNPSGPATWPAFWLTGATRWPPEIDIFEMYGRKTGESIHNQYATVHWGKNNTRSMGYLTRSINLPDDTDSTFHTYACEWTEKHIRFYTDGREVAHIRVNKSLRKWLDEEMVIVINNCFDRKYLKYLPESFSSNYFIVDWIRVYKKNE